MVIYSILYMSNNDNYPDIIQIYCEPFFRADILPRQSRKGASVSNNIILKVLCMLACWHGPLGHLNGTKPSLINVISYTAAFPVMKSQNVYNEKENSCQSMVNSTMLA